MFRRFSRKGPRTPVPPWASHMSSAEWHDFQVDVEAALRALASGFQIAATEAMVTVDLDGKQAVFGLSNPIQWYTQLPPDQRHAEIGRHFRTVIQAYRHADEDAQAARDWSLARQQLRIRLYAEDVLPGAELVARDVGPGLLAVLVRDLPETIATVRPEALSA